MNSLINSLNLQLTDLYSKQCIELVNIFNKFLDIINTCFKYIIINNQNIKHLKKYILLYLLMILLILLLIN